MRTAILVMLAASGVWGQTKTMRSALYAAAGPELMEFDVDVANATLTKRGSVMLPDGVQEAFPHPSHKYLYVTWSDGVIGKLVPEGEKSPHGVTAFKIDPKTGALTQHGDPISLRARAVFLSVDVDGTHIVVANNDPSGITVHAIKPDGTLGAQIPQGPVDVGVYAHQVRVDPSNKAVILVTRGNAPTATKKEDPGAIKVIDYKKGILANRQSIAPNKGFGFQVRHLDFHPSGKWDFVTLEKQNKIYVFKRSADGSLGDAPLFMKDPLDHPIGKGGQALSTIHVHPSGKFLYAANRGSNGGENSIAVFTINQETGEPTLIQDADTHGIQPRTFSIDPSGKILVVANMTATKEVPACLSVYRIGGDGKLEYVRKYDIETGGTRTLFWTGFVGLP